MAGMSRGFQTCCQRQDRKVRRSKVSHLVVTYINILTYQNASVGQRTKLYRYDAVSKALTVLGRGNVVTDPGQNLDLAGNSILNDHRLTLNKAAGGQTFYSGIRLFSVADTMGAVEVRASLLMMGHTAESMLSPLPRSCLILLPRMRYADAISGFRSP